MFYFFVKHPPLPFSLITTVSSLTAQPTTTSLIMRHRSTHIMQLSAPIPLRRPPRPRRTTKRKRFTRKWWQRNTISLRRILRRRTIFCRRPSSAHSTNTTITNMCRRRRLATILVAMTTELVGRVYSVEFVLQFQISLFSADLGVNFEDCYWFFGVFGHNF